MTSSVSQAPHTLSPALREAGRLLRRSQFQNFKEAQGRARTGGRLPLSAACFSRRGPELPPCLRPGRPASLATGRGRQVAQPLQLRDSFLARGEIVAVQAGDQTGDVLLVRAEHGLDSLRGRARRSTSAGGEPSNRPVSAGVIAEQVLPAHGQLVGGRDARVAPRGPPGPDQERGVLTAGESVRPSAEKISVTTPAPMPGEGVAFLAGGDFQEMDRRIGRLPQASVRPSGEKARQPTPLVSFSSGTIPRRRPARESR